MRRLLMVGRTRYRLPLSESLERKFAALRARFDLRVLGSATDGVRGDDTFHLVPPLRLGLFDGAAFYATLPFRIAEELRGFRPDAVVAQSPFEAVAVLLGRRIARSRASLIVELHGDWRTFPRLYGSSLRGALAPITDRLGTWSLRRADVVRTLSPFTTRLARDVGVEPAAVFTAFTDLEAFSDPPVAPLPEAPAALFVGVLERYKNVENLAAAWRLAAARVPEARLNLVGDGHRRDVAQALVFDLPAQTSWQPAVPAGEVVHLLDQSWVLLLPSRSEGLPRVVIEAFCRGRAVVGGRTGGTPDVVEDSVSGVLVDPDDVEGIAAALERMLTDRELCETMGAAAHEHASVWQQTPDEYAERMVELVERAVA